LNPLLTKETSTKVPTLDSVRGGALTAHGQDNGI